MMNQDGYGDGYHMDGFMNGFSLYSLIPILLIVLVVFVIIKLLFNNSDSQTNHKSALNELNRKLVTGEISEEEYRRKKSLIKEK